MSSSQRVRSKSEGDKKTMEAVEGELRCPICLELYRCPIILPCSHILCRNPCAERLFIRENFIRCPVCRDNSFVTGGLECLPRVISLENIIDRYCQTAERDNDNDDDDDDGDGNDDVIEGAEGGTEATDDVVKSPDDIPCQLCEEDVPRRAVKSCLNCNASYCAKCLAISHPNKEPFIQHRLVEPRRYPKPAELRCPLHDAKVNIYCDDCKMLGCLLCADDPKAHPGHNVRALAEAVDEYKTMLNGNLEQMETCNNQLTSAIRAQNEHLATFKQHVSDRRVLVQEECDSLLHEVETRRDFFFSDLEYEEKSMSERVHHGTNDLLQHSTSLSSLMHYTKEVLKETDHCAFLQQAKSVHDKVRKALDSVQIVPPSPSTPTLQHKVVDLRKERAILKDMSYLTVPKAPAIEVSKCSRSCSSVVIVLQADVNEGDVLDGYKVYYCTQEQKDRGDKEVMEFRTPGEERNRGRGPHSSSAVCLIHDNLDSDTKYFFSVRAYNGAGQSDVSTIVNCTTLSRAEAKIPVPEIGVELCRTFTYSIQLSSTSPMLVNPDSGISHYLLYRESSVNKIWKSLSLCSRADHRVFGLEPDTMFDFAIMACDKNGECQVSNMVTLRTERSAY